jgi:drug/metabolite transporter (DMT)-like permease
MRRGYLALLLLALIWGAAFFFIKIGVRDMSPATLVLSRAVLGAVTIGAIFAARRQTPFPTGTGARLVPFLTIAILGSLFPWAAIAFGEQSISSALASILNATTPLWTAVFAYWVTPTERPSALNYLGVAIGFLGTGILIAPTSSANPSGRPRSGRWQSRRRRAVTRWRRWFSDAGSAGSARCRSASGS